MSDEVKELTVEDIKRQIIQTCKSVRQEGHNNKLPDCYAHRENHEEKHLVDECGKLGFFIAKTEISRTAPTATLGFRLCGIS